MKLVLLFFCVIFGVFLIVTSLILLSSIRINIKRVYLSNMEGKLKKKHFDKEIQVYLEIYLLGIIKIARIKLRKKMLVRLKNKANVEIIKKDAEIIKPFHLVELIKKLKIKTKRANLDLEIGIDDVILTAYATAIISSMIRLYFWNY